MSGTPLPPFDLEIDDLEIEGLPPTDAPKLERALREELARLFLERGVPAQLQADRAVEATELPPLPSGRTAIDTGVALARALYEGWSR